MRFLTLCLALSVSAHCFAAGGGEQKKAKPLKFTTDPKTGVKYFFFKHDKKAATAVEGDYATVIMQYRNDRDSLVFDSRTTPARRRNDTLGIVMIPLKKSFKGCLEQGIEMMAAGDSAAFSINTDSLFFKTFKATHLPAFVRSGTNLTFFVKLVKFQSEAQIKEEQQQLMVKHQMEQAKLKAVESQRIAKYLSDNKLNVQPTADSLFILSRQGGTGKQIEVGDSVYVKYTGMFLDGRVFDATSKHGDRPLDVVYSPNMALIKGWVLVLGTMKEGEKARILCPSALAYGPNGFPGAIPPYEPLVFDMEVVKVVAHK